MPPSEGLTVCHDKPLSGEFVGVAANVEAGFPDVLEDGSTCGDVGEVELCFCEEQDDRG